MKFSELTPREVAAICNGCGGKGGWVRPPQFRFRADCNHHDFHYWRGGSERDRRKADRQFLLSMIGDSLELRGPRQFFHILAAIVYYNAVRFCGRKFFFYTRYPRNRAALDSWMRDFH